MRIGNQDSSGGDRARIFRNRHGVGERVRARLLGWEQPGLAWVDIQGQELLARIHSAPDPGQTLSFLVVQLYPDIMLQELHGGASGQGAPLDMTGAVHAFWTARSLYESAARPLLNDWTAHRPPARDRRKSLHAVLGRSPEAMPLYLRLLGAVQVANAFLGAAGAGRLCYPAWLLPPRALAAEMLVRAQPDGPDNNGMEEALLAFALPRSGQCLARVMVRRHQGAGREPGRITGNCRVSMERPTLGRAVDAALDALLAEAGLSGLDRLTATPLAPEHRAGLLAGLLHSKGASSSGFATRV